jgi:transposase
MTRSKMDRANKSRPMTVKLDQRLTLMPPEVPILRGLVRWLINAAASVTNCTRRLGREISMKWQGYPIWRADLRRRQRLAARCSDRLAVRCSFLASHRHPRFFAAWLGLVPKQMSTGDRRYLAASRSAAIAMLFVQGARAILLRPKSWVKHSFGPWLTTAAQRLHRNILTIALANKLARIALSVLNPRPQLRNAHRTGSRIIEQSGVYRGRPRG